MRPACLSLLLLSAATLAAGPFDRVSDPSVAEVAASFAAPPSDYSSQVTWGWGGVMSREVIARDLDHLLAMNIHQAWVEPGRNPEAPYLSPAYFENVKIAVEEAKKRHMHLWFDDDGGYPSGFAGGKITQEHPELAMKALLPPETVAVEAGQIFSIPTGETLIAAVATDSDSGERRVLTRKGTDGTWTAPATGHWRVATVRWAYRSGPTRSANNTSGAKDTEHALMDYLSPEANRWFIDWTFEQYRRAVGDEFGHTFLGFRGDEAAFGFNPWTPALPDEFAKRKGYDVRPYLPAIAAIQIGRQRNSGATTAPNLDPDHRAFADYCDVWSDLFGQNFFSADAQWCADHGLTLQHHIEHEEILPQLAIANGDYFKCMREVQVPGVDVIWHQMWHDVVADFPKLASSAAHLNGHPQAMSETFAAMGGNYPTPDLEEAGWILHHQVALGITHFEYMFMPASAPRAARPAGAARPRPTAAPGAFANVRGAAPAGYRYLNDPKFPELALDVNRATYVLAQGRPAAQIGVLIPSSSFWFGDTAVNRSFLAIVHGLLERQRDVDFVDDASFGTRLTLQGATLVNQSHQAYRAIIVPPSVAVSKRALDQLRAFAAAGGNVIFLGGAPQLIVNRTFLDAAPPADLGWATVEPGTEINEKLLSTLPEPDVALAQAAPGLKYHHRALKDADVYYFFNEGETAVDVSATVAAPSRAQQAERWDATDGRMAPAPEIAFHAGHAAVPIKLAPWATQFVVLRAP